MSTPKPLPNPFKAPGADVGPDPDGSIAEASAIIDEAIAAGVDWLQLRGMSPDDARAYIKANRKKGRRSR